MRGVSSTTISYYIHVMFYFSPRRTLVVMDSRGRRIQAVMETPNIVCRSYPGATLTTIQPRIDNLVNKYRPITCLIVIGVNDLTHFDHVTRRATVVHDDPFNLANLVIARVLKLRQYLLSHYPHVKFIFGGINGLDIDRFNKEVSENSVQYVIDDCVTQVNSYLRLLNRVKHYYHPRFTSKVHIWRAARRVNRYHLLEDGLHLGGVVTKSWITAIYRTHRISTLNLPC